MSIVIPVYNSAIYISHCLDSILEQTYRDFEIICINDGSTDNSHEIVQKYQQKYTDYIKLYSQKNSGAGAARNFGMSLAKGTYLIFVDSDDYLDPDYISVFVKEAEQSGAEMVIGGYRRVDNDGRIRYVEQLHGDYKWASFKRVGQCGRIYRLSFIKKYNLKFLDSRIGEDFYFNVRAAVFASQVVAIDYVGYNYLFNDASLSNNHQSDYKPVETALYMLNSVYSSLNIEELSSEKYMQLEYLFIKFSVYYLLFYGRKFTSDQITETYDKLFALIKGYFPLYRKNKLISLFKPKCENIQIRFSVCCVILLDQLSICKPILKLYAKG